MSSRILSSKAQDDHRLWLRSIGLRSSWRNASSSWNCLRVLMEAIGHSTLQLTFLKKITRRIFRDREIGGWGSKLSETHYKHSKKTISWLLLATQCHWHFLHFTQKSFLFLESLFQSPIFCQQELKHRGISTKDFIFSFTSPASLSSSLFTLRTSKTDNCSRSLILTKRRAVIEAHWAVRRGSYDMEASIYGLVQSPLASARWFTQVSSLANISSWWKMIDARMFWSHWIQRREWF